MSAIRRFKSGAGRKGDLGYLIFIRCACLCDTGPYRKFDDERLYEIGKDNELKDTFLRKYLMYFSLRALTCHKY